MLHSSFEPPTESGVSAYRKALIPALADAVSAALDPRPIRKSFYACGIEPFDPSVDLDRLPNQLSIAKISSLTSLCTFSGIMNKKVITSDEFVEENAPHEEGKCELNKCSVVLSKLASVSQHDKQQNKSCDKTISGQNLEEEMEENVLFAAEKRKRKKVSESAWGGQFDFN
ncbi:uncharacterized protein MONOS_16727 [Monocercomonoides exilis]|uniref:uncharacterized protein n=1 Tax=Monocercomonoides exilis TaxID=2049356 RepID=UPI00355A2C43|nr:hypothetical protein MONOS_16727 [Monocercomonoides exilis]|eukprot:MONOS_16727.1-p1 / transcript=MONOS_16727.1 / gene=MONOS_16727 / organism=Monocercomonoides_exilis_PA203 / gene_product=unspecified product / transcript_product=unspecified product / location=Mono_scaffold02089:822-1395(+) / protein_length=171 / sequence_SO=supercontig / SO=protein_coding / is_pseudo=false